MKNLFFSCLGLTCIFLFWGCKGGTSDSVKNAKDSNAARINREAARERAADSSVVLSKADADFVVDATSGAMMDVEMGKMAEERSTTPRIKHFGAMMVRDHGEDVKELKRLAGHRHVVLPDSVSLRQQEQIKDLRKKSGKDFDRAYVRMMVRDQKEDIEEFGKQAGEGMDSLTRMFASRNLQMLRRHLDSANKLGDMLGLNNVNAYQKPMPPH